MTTLEEIAGAFAAFRQSNEARWEQIQRDVEELENRANRRQVGGSSRGPNSEALSNLHRFLRSGITNEMTTLSDPDGGYTVSPDLSPIIEAAIRDVSPLRRLSPARTVDGEGLEEIFAVSGGTARWVSETVQRGTATETPPLAVVTTPLREIEANPAASQRLLDMSSFDVEGFLREDLGGALGEVEGAAFINGDGIAKPRGILNYETAATADATREFGVIQHVVSGSATDLTADALRSLPLKLHSRFRRRGAWLMNGATAGEAMVLKDGDGRYLWGSDGLDGSAPDQLLGYPVHIDENLPDVGAGEFPIAFGDFSRGYRVVDHRSGLRILRDPFTRKGFVQFYTTKLVGGGLRDSRAIKLLKIAAS